MPRKLRQSIDHQNAFLHIVCRGNNQRRIFRRKQDYQKLLKIIEKVKKLFPFYLYSCNLLPNHLHLAVEIKNISISKIMHQINLLYAKYFHRHNKTSGHLFQDRFYSSLIDKESYFWEVSRYVDLNAVRAGLVKGPEDYRWSSYSIYCQKCYNGKLIDRDRFLKYGGENLEQSRLSYLKFVKEGLQSKKQPPFRVKKKMV